MSEPSVLPSRRLTGRAMASRASRIRAGLRAVRDWEHENGALNSEELAAALEWVALLDPDDHVVFRNDLRSLLAGHAGSVEVEDYLADWRATAHAWSDPDTRAALLEDVTAPLYDVEIGSGPLSPPPVEAAD